MKKSFNIVIAIIAIVIILGIYFYLTSSDNAIKIADNFEDKIVYTTDSTADTNPLKKDCQERGGIFNSCGSPCPKSAKVCVAACAFTCEFYQPEEKCEILKSRINTFMEGANYCKMNEDCTIKHESLPLLYPFCNKPLNKNAYVSHIKENLEQFVKNCPEEAAPIECGIPSTICLNNKCVQK